jgi:hypothetical protein
LLGFTVKATYPEHHVKVQVLSRCCTQDPCNWVGEGKGEGGEQRREETYLSKTSDLLMFNGEPRKVQSVSAEVEALMQYRYSRDS